jgi:diacylglycerol kinase (ATP)
MKIGFIVNPNAGVHKNSYQEVHDLAERTFNGRHQVEIIPTKGIGDATRIARHFADGRFDVVAAVGGDGTANETAQGLMQTDTAFTVIPYGSGNGLARGLSIPMDRRRAVELILREEYKMIDVGEVLDGDQQKLFFGFAGIGFDALIGKRFNEQDGRRGFITYLKLALSTYRLYEPYPLRIRFNDQEIFTKPFILAIANTKEYGNSAKIAPMAIPDDGLFDISLLQDISFWKGLRSGWRLFTGSIHKISEMNTYRSRHIEVEPENRLLYHLDGEPCETGNTLIFRVLPKFMKVLENR